MKYQYIAVSTTGQRIKGVLEADSEQRAEELLWQRNLTIISLKRQWQLPPLEKLFPTLFGVKRSDLISFSRQLASLLGTGVPILPALTMILAEVRKPSFRRILRDIIANLEMGNSFSQALGRHPTVFPSTYLRLIQVGEEIGNLSLVLNQLTTYLEREEAIRSRIARALIYPFFVLAVATLAIFLLITVVLPAMAGLLKEFGGELPWITKALIAVASFIQANALKIMPVLFILGILGWLYCRTPRGERLWGKFILRLPLIGGVSLVNSLAGVARTLNLLLRAGVSIREALDLLILTTPSPVFRDNLRVIRDNVLEGQLLSQALRQSPLFPAMFSQAVGVGEHTGELPSYLQTLTNYYEEALDRGISRLMGLMEPIIILTVGFIVGFIAVSVISPLYSTIAQMK